LKTLDNPTLTTGPVSWNRWRGAYIRRLSRWLGRRPYTLQLRRPLVTFTFDDFPRSALSAGGGILEEHNYRGTYFVSMGLVGQAIETGDMFVQTDLDALLAYGHELGCHTHEHLPAWETRPAAYLASVERNTLALSSLPQAVRPTTHSYPISYPRPGSKRRIETRFRSCRFGGQGSNRGVVDLNALNSFFIEQSAHDIPAIEEIIDANAAQRGWLIFSTHDVTEHPTRYGCTPSLFERIVRHTRNSGTTVLTMNAALDELGVPTIGQ
jgi:peptidoglycan/xylan/chitin deacetylase (PgdA/CDA1 family)